MSERAETIVIASPLEADLVARIRAAAPAGATVVHEPDLLPVPRYVADHKGADDFRRSAEGEKKWRGILARATVLWDFPAEVTAADGGLALIPNVKWVQTTSSGVGQMLLRLGLAEGDLLVTTARGVHAGPLAEFAIMALLVHTKNLARLQAEQKAHRWERYCGLDLPGRTMTIVGAGHVGAEVGRLAKAFGMATIAVVNRPSPERAAALHADEVRGPDDLGAAIARADCIVLCTPHTARTEGMIGAEVIANMKPGVVFINIARGQVVDQAALVDALRSGRISFAALDVAAVEPLPDDSPLWDLPNVLISPHSASTVQSENAKITDIFVENIRHYMAGNPERMRNIFDLKQMY